MLGKPYLYRTHWCIQTGWSPGKIYAVDVDTGEKIVGDENEFIAIRGVDVWSDGRQPGRFDPRPEPVGVDND